MKLLGLLFYENFKLKNSFYNLNVNYFIKSKVTSEIENFSNEILKKFEDNKFYKIKDKLGDLEFILCYSSNSKFQCIILSEISYPVNSSFDLIKKLLNNEKDRLLISKLWDEYLDATNVDKVSKIQKEIDETKIIMMDNLDQLVKRGADLDELTKKTEEIKNQSFLMRKKTEELNKCCFIL